ncbi:mitochondrial metalloendopeptidase OMA1 isoform X2 [Cornus florida]|uniref:mitochondrial metalloendopeptidase OMA1 isoform X2 n=1 Tax=Cornus florida TaxID=4283 RepID=UPI00289B0E46|nr:mitochondrial metalloendopeptidase OMA1 isoform X2 [Cornus florida]
MGWYRRSKFAFDAFRSFASKIVPKNPSPDSISRTNRYTSLIPSLGKSKVSGLSFSSPISRNLGFEFGTKQSPYNPFLGAARRHYYVDRYQVHHFRPRGPRRWFRNPKYVLTVVLLGSGVVITVYFGNLENVPYTNRKHFVLLSRSAERQIGEAEFQKMKKAFRGKILPAIHPESVRVQLIAKDIINALERGLRTEQVWTDPGYADSGGMHESGGEHETLAALIDSPEGKWHREDEILDDSWVQQSRKKGKQRGTKPSTGHLEGLNWEVLVVNEPVVNAFCLPGGKIVVFTGLLEHFQTNAEIATIIGHEVGHAVARHAAEGITKNLWFAILQLILYQFIMPDLVNTMSTLLLRLPFSRRFSMALWVREVSALTIEQRMLNSVMLGTKAIQECAFGY